MESSLYLSTINLTADCEKSISVIPVNPSLYISSPSSLKKLHCLIKYYLNSLHLHEEFFFLREEKGLLFLLKLNRFDTSQIIGVNQS